MRCSDRKAMFLWLAGAATLLLASAQPVWAECPAKNWDSRVDMKVDDSDFDDHVPTNAKFELKKRFWVCGLKIETLSSFKPEFNNLRFRCDWTGEQASCESTRSIRLHQDDNGVWRKHRVFLSLSRTEIDGRHKRLVTIFLEDASGEKHAGVAHGTGDE